MSNWIDEYVIREEQERKNKEYKVAVYYGTGRWEVTYVTYDTEKSARLIAKDNSAETNFFWCVIQNDEKLALYHLGKEILPQ